MKDRLSGLHANTGGTIIGHVRPVDLQASMAQGAEILTRWANLLATAVKEQKLENPLQADYAADIVFWQSVANEFTVKTRLTWRDGWFRDLDSVTGEWSTQQDAMHLVPVFCEVSDRVQEEQLRPFLAQPPSHSHGWAPLSWPPVVMTLIGAASAAQMPLDAVELAYRFILSRRASAMGKPCVRHRMHGTERQGLYCTSVLREA
jgi:hypothetical protein